jgi:hypothetical protein
VVDEAGELLTLLFRVATTVAHDDVAISQIDQASEVIHDIRLGTGAKVSGPIRAWPGFSNVDKELVAQAEVGEASSLCLAQLLEQVETFAKALRAEPG